MSARFNPLLLTVLLSAACSPKPRVVAGGDPARGAAHLSNYGCGSCHSIPGIRGAHGLVGPSLAGVGGRQYIAGMLPNEPAQLAHWIVDPHSVNPKTAMPNIGVTAKDAADISAYLYTLVETPGGHTW
ncbi:MAG: cytochrome c, class [Bryobacterales bacterium]|nr:cytochrome c, class [Bryobacterales bacterium]